MIIKKFNDQYIDQLVDLFEEYRSFYNFPKSPLATKEFLQQLQQREASVIFIALDEENDAVMGFVNLYPCYSSLTLKPIWILNDLGVADQYKGAGISKALIVQAMDYAKETGAIRLELKTDKINNRAMNLYKTMGFNIDAGNVYYRVSV